MWMHKDGSDAPGGPPWQPMSAEQLAEKFLQETAEDGEDNSDLQSFIADAMRYALKHTCEEACVGHGERLTHGQFFDQALVAAMNGMIAMPQEFDPSQVANACVRYASSLVGIRQAVEAAGKDLENLDEEKRPCKTKG